MNDLMLVFAVQTHLSILLHKLYLSECIKTHNEAYVSAKTNDKEKEEIDQGIIRWTDFKQLRTFTGYDDDENQGRKEKCVKDCSGTFEDYRRIITNYDSNNKEEKDKAREDFATIDKRKSANTLYYLLFDLEKECKDLDQRHEVSEIQFGVQEATFRILGNHDVLRLYLSDRKDRFERCGRYIFGDSSKEKARPSNAKSIKYFLDDSTLRPLIPKDS